MRSVVVLALVAACNVSEGFGDGEDAGFVACDAGFDEGGSLDGGVVVDAGFCVASEADGDAPDGGAGAPDDGVCGDLVVKACGPAGECADDPGCAAADLTSRFEPENCAAGIADDRRFPACAEGSCDRLVEKVCGVDCADAPGCGPAQTLRQRADDGDASAEGSCGQALTDEALFPPCEG